MAQVEALSCPVCGGPLNPDVDQCKFCGSYVVIRTDMPRLSRATLNQSLIREHIDKFRSRTQLNSYDAEAHYGLGVAYYSLGLINDAVDELTWAAKITPENPHIQAQLAVVCRDSLVAGNAGAAPQMNERLHTALLLDPAHVEANVLKGQILLDKCLYEEALAQYHSMPLEAQARVKARFVAIFERLGVQSLQSRNWGRLNWTWNALDPIDGEAARRLMLRFLSMHESLVPARLEQQPLLQHRKISSRSSRFARMIMAAIVGLFLGFVQFAIVAFVIPVEEDEAMSTWVAIVGLASFALFLGSPIIAALWYRRHHSRISTLTGSLQESANVESGTQSFVSKSDILAGNVDSQTIRQVVEAVIERLWSWEIARTGHVEYRRPGGPKSSHRYA